MKYLKYNILVYLLLMYNQPSAQIPQEWVQRYNGPGNSFDGAYSIAVDASGSVYVTGTSQGIGTSNDYTTIKYNSSGVQQWIQIYNGPGNFIDEVSSLVIDVSGNVYVTGQSYGNQTLTDYATIKYNSSGVQQWVQRYNGPGNNFDNAYFISVDASGNVYITGYSYGNGTNYDYATVKYDSSGVQQWVQRYNGPGNYSDRAYSIALDDLGNVYVTGGSSSGTDYDYATIKYNFSGVQQWVQRYDGPGMGSDYAWRIIVDTSGNIYITGNSYGINTGSDYATIKYNSAGVQQWVQRYNGPGNNDEVSFLAVDASGNVYITGYSYGIGMDYDFATIKYNSSGVQHWVQRYSGTGSNSDYAYSLAVDPDSLGGNVYVTGWSYESGTAGDYTTIKYNSFGVQLWVQKYNGVGNNHDAARSIAIDASGNVYVTGYSYGSGTDYDFATIKYSKQIGIKPISGEIPDKFSLSQNYPNPFNPSTKIRFSIPSVGQRHAFDLQLKVYDILGREAAILVYEALAPGTYEVEWDSRNYPSGVYYYTLSTDGFTQSKIMVLVK